jgi:Ca2+-binding RTX toxin-like protein
VLVGGAGNDRLVGGPGTNVLIGGMGADRLTGGTGDDLLVAGPTDFDLDPTGLANLRAEWASGRPYAERVDHLSGAPGGANNGTFLTVGPSTGEGDGSRDVLTGGRGTDWFVAVFLDRLDRKPGEELLDV